MDYVFYIKVFADGKQIPSMEFFQDIYRPLNSLGSGYLNGSQGIINELDNIKKVLSKELLSYSFADNDWYILDIGFDNSLISNGFDEFRPISIPTQELYSLLINWSIFLNKYEEGLIPNLKYAYDITPDETKL